MHCIRVDKRYCMHCRSTQDMRSTDNSHRTWTCVKCGAAHDAVKSIFERHLRDSRRP